jgi:hypothetical protein
MKLAKLIFLVVCIAFLLLELETGEQSEFVAVVVVEMPIDSFEISYCKI